MILLGHLHFITPCQTQYKNRIYYLKKFFKLKEQGVYFVVELKVILKFKKKVLFEVMHTLWY